MRIVHLGKYYPPASGGIESHTQTLARGLARLGHDVRVVVVNHADKSGQDVTFHKWKRTPQTEDRDGNITITRAARYANIAKLDASPGLHRILKDEAKRKPDIWHLHTPNITMMLAVLAQRNIRPLVITHHSDIIKQKSLRHIVKPLEHSVYGRAKHIFSDSPTYIGGSEILTRFEAKTSALPLGIELEPYLHPNSDSIVHSEKYIAEITMPIWVSVGRLVYYKGLDTAIKALKHVPGTLVVVGTGPMEQAWKALAAHVGVQDRIIWKGRTSADELVGLYHAATAHWFPSNARSEGFGLVQVEAMASGCPTINTNIPHSGVSWVCQHEVAGLTVPMNNPEAFAAAANRLLEEKSLRERLSETGIVEAKTRFHAEVMSKTCEAAYHRVLGIHS